MTTTAMRASGARLSLPLTPRAREIDTLPDVARLSIADVASLLNIHTKTLRRWVDRGVAPAPIAGGPAMQWSAGAVRAFLEGGAA